MWYYNVNYKGCDEKVVKPIPCREAAVGASREGKVLRCSFGAERKKSGI